MNQASSTATDRQVWRILIVDDSPEDRAEIRRLLLRGSSRKYAFVESENGMNALEAIRDSHEELPDCILLDHYLPDMNAPEILKELIGKRQSPPCPVVVITGDDSEAICRHIIRAGAQEFIGKSWMTPTSLTRTVENALERWGLQQRLLEEERRFRLATRVARIAIAEIDYDTNTMHLTPHSAALLGLPRETSAVPRSLVHGLFHPDDLSTLEEKISESHDPDGTGEFNLDHRIIRPDGRIQWLGVRKQVYFEGGRSKRALLAMTDIHDRKIAEAAMKASEERLRLALEASDTGMWAWEISTDRSTWSPECYRIHAISEREFDNTGSGFLRLIHPDDRDRVWETVGKALDEHTLYESEFRIIRPGGEVIWVANRGRASYDPMGRPLRMLGTITDITARKQSDEKLARSEAFARSLVESSADCVKGISLDGRILWMNEHGKRLQEIRDFDSLLGEDWASLWEPSGLEAEARAAVETARNGGVGRFRGFRATFAGTPRWWDVAITAVPGPDGRPEQLLAVSRDITESHAANEALRVSEERFARAQNAARIGTWDWNIVADEAYWTETAWKLFRPGLPFPEKVTLESWLQAIHPEDREKASRQSRLALETGIFAAEYRVLHPDGSTLHIESHGETQFDAERRPVRMLGTVRDVTARRAIVDELRRREWELQTLADNMPDIFVRFDRELRHLFVNAAVTRVTGIAREAFLGRTNREIGMPEHLCDLWDEALRSVFRSKQARTIEFTSLAPDGERYFESRLIPEFDSDDEVACVLAIVRDATDQKRSQEALRDQDRNKNEFLATLAHELRNPLAPLRNGLSILRSRPPQAIVEEIQEMMGRQLGHMVRLIDDLLDVSRISQGKFEIRREPVSARTVIEHAVEASRPTFDAMNHELIVRVDDGPIPLNGDLTRLAQVVGNLLNNAAKYTPEGGRVTLSLGVEGAEAVIRVVDNGTGISSEMLPKVFDIFTQVDRTLDRAQGGLGIGLSLVKRLVEMHGGAITAESPGVARGSTFTVRLPLAPPAANVVSPPKPDTRTPREAARVPIRILVVDDSPDAALSMSHLLELLGHTARVAHDGPAAIAIAAEFRPELVFLDIGLPGMNGYEACRILKANPDLATTRFVALTGWGADLDRERSRDAGFTLHTVKPIDYNQIEEILRETAAERASAGAATGDLLAGRDSG